MFDDFDTQIQSDEFECRYIDWEKLMEEIYGEET